MTMIDPSKLTNLSTEDETANGWDEARLAAALAKLQATHVQLRQLRDTIPSIIRPMRSELSSPETVYAELARAATGAVNNVQDFAAAIRDPALQGLLTHAKESKDENPEGVAGWLATQHEDWLDPVSLGVETKIKIEDGLDGIGAMEEKGWSKEEVVEAFKKAHPTVNVEIEAGGEIKASLPSPARITFRINDAPSKEGTSSVYKVSCEETGKAAKPTKLVAGVIQAFAKRPRADDLWHTLKMIAAYSNLKSQSCQKCRKLIDREGQLPVVRFPKAPAVVSTDLSAEWEALHLGCTPT